MYQVILGGGLEPMTSQLNSANVFTLNSVWDDFERILAIKGLTLLVSVINDAESFRR